MISRDLLGDAVEASLKCRTHISASMLQRRIRVGWATASQLIVALEDAGVLGAWENGGRRTVLIRDATEAHRMIAEAIESGRVVLS